MLVVHEDGLQHSMGDVDLLEDAAAVSFVENTRREGAVGAPSASDDSTSRGCRFCFMRVV